MVRGLVRGVVRGTEEKFNPPGRRKLRRASPNFNLINGYREYPLPNSNSARAYISLRGVKRRDLFSYFYSIPLLPSALLETDGRL